MTECRRHNPARSTAKELSNLGRSYIHEGAFSSADGPLWFATESLEPRVERLIRILETHTDRRERTGAMQQLAGALADAFAIGRYHVDEWKQPVVRQAGEGTDAVYTFAPSVRGGPKHSAQARTMQSKKRDRNAPRAERLRQVIREGWSSSLTGDDTFARIIRDDVLRKLGYKKDAEWPSVRTIQRAVMAVKKDRPR